MKSAQYTRRGIKEKKGYIILRVQFNRAVAKYLVQKPSPLEINFATLQPCVCKSRSDTSFLFLFLLLLLLLGFCFVLFVCLFVCFVLVKHKPAANFALIAYRNVVEKKIGTKFSCSPLKARSLPIYNLLQLLV